MRRDLLTPNSSSHQLQSQVEATYLYSNSTKKAVFLNRTIAEDRIVHERLKPPLRPPLPKRMLGGTNFREDMVDVRLSISASAEAFSGNEELFGGFEVVEESGTVARESWRWPLLEPLGCCPCWEPLIAAEL